MDSGILVRATSFQVGGTVIEIHPKEIRGSWDQGFALDVHTISSTMIGYNEFGHPEFDTVRSPLGELVYRLKYRGDKGAIPSIVEPIAGFMKTSDIKPDVVVPMPPSNLQRTFQPVIEVGTEFAPSWPRFLESPLTQRPLRNQSPRHK